MTRAWLLPILLPGLLVAACSSSSDGGGSSSGTSSATHPACGLAQYPPDYPTTCQALLDRVCCDEEKRCAANAACSALVTCVNACPIPRTDACVNACDGPEAETAGEELNAIAACTKSAAFGSDPAAASCSWPK